MTFTIHRTIGKWEAIFDSSLPLPAASSTLTHEPGDYCRELTSAYGELSELKLWFPSANRFFYLTVEEICPGKFMHSRFCKCLSF